MQYAVKVRTQAKQNLVEQIQDGSFVIHITAAPQQGKANSKVIELMADFLKVPKWRLHIKAGNKSPHKIIEKI